MAESNSGGAGTGGKPLPLIGAPVLTTKHGMLSTIVSKDPSSKKGHLLLEKCETKPRTAELIFLAGQSTEKLNALHAYFVANNRKMPPFARLTFVEKSSDGNWVEVEGRDVMDEIKLSRQVMRQPKTGSKTVKPHCIGCGGEVKEGEAVDTICMGVDDDAEDEAEAEDAEEEEDEEAGGERRAAGDEQCKCCQRVGERCAICTREDAEKKAAEKKAAEDEDAKKEAGRKRKASDLDGEGGEGTRPNRVSVDAGAQTEVQEAGGGDEVLLVGDGGTTEEFQRLMGEKNNDAEAFVEAVAANINEVETKVLEEREAKDLQLVESTERYAAKAAAFVLEVERAGGEHKTDLEAMSELEKAFRTQAEKQKEIDGYKSNKKKLEGEKGEFYASIREQYDGQIEKCKAALDEATVTIRGAYRESKRMCMAREEDATPGKAKAVADAVFDEHVVKAKLDF